LATLTALRRASPGRVELELDGRPWRTVPDDVVVRCGLHAGLALDRARLRALRMELRRTEALAAAGRALAQAPLSRRRLSEKLQRRGVTPAAERAAVGTLTAAGLVDDARLVHARAEALAARGWGDLAIEARLERDGFEAKDVTNALAGLPPQGGRAAELATKLARPRPQAWAALARRGFTPDAIEEALGALDVDETAG
jgi:SOS response regulatory protein OraA/RecX